MFESIAARVLLASACLIAGACGNAHETVPWEQAEPPLLLARHPELLVELDLPPDSRGGVRPPEEIPVTGPFHLRRADDGFHHFESPLPIRPRSLFFSSPPADMELLVDGRPMPTSGKKRPTWSFSKNTLQFGLRTSSPPRNDQVVLRYPRATAREQALNLQWADATSPADFSLRTAWQDGASRYGVFLPAPARASWRLTVPLAGVLSMEAGMLEPETTDLEPSDGARLQVLVEASGETSTVLDLPLEPGLFKDQRVDLSRWAGQEVLLSLATLPGQSPRYDYVFVGEPTLYTPVSDPPRIVLLFADTLRQDHVGWHGYERNTTPFLDRWAEDATIFEQARAVSPWTLPSVRTIYTGAEPERWGAAATMQHQAARAGWATAAFVGNVYLSANFDMEAGWGTHYVENWPLARAQVKRTRAFLSAHHDRPSMVMAHLMDIHLPYTEPGRFRRMFAERQAPGGLGLRFNRSQVLRAAKGKEAEAVKRYVVNRYDASVRYVDHEIEKLLREQRENDVVIFFSDHGEEFWDHDAFEHGHTLYDELLLVPLVVKAPAMPAGRVEAPVSLMDLAPTVLDLAGAPPLETAKGRSLLPLARGEPGMEEAFKERLQGFGRPLYGDEKWGVLADHMKYTTGSGVEALFDLANDPGETRDLVASNGGGADLDAWRTTMGEALDRPTQVVLAIQPTMSRSKGSLTATLTVPGGIAAAWAGEDPTMKSEATVVTSGEQVEVTWSGSHARCREVFVLPEEPSQDLVDGLSLEVGKKTYGARAGAAGSLDGSRHVLIHGRTLGGRVEVSWALVPEPEEEATTIHGFDPETADALKQLGYLD